MLAQFIIFVRIVSSNLSRIYFQYVCFYLLSSPNFYWPLFLYTYFSFLNSLKSITGILIAAFQTEYLAQNFCYLLQDGVSYNSLEPKFYVEGYQEAMMEDIIASFSISEMLFCSLKFLEGGELLLLKINQTLCV